MRLVANEKVLRWLALIIQSYFLVAWFLSHCCHTLSQKQKEKDMSTIRKHYNNWQSIVRIQGHPSLTKSFKNRTDAKRWGIQTEL